MFNKKQSCTVRKFSPKPYNAVITFILEKRLREGGMTGTRLHSDSGTACDESMFAASKLMGFP